MLTLMLTVNRLTLKANRVSFDIAAKMCIVRKAAIAFARNIITEQGKNKLKAQLLQAYSEFLYLCCLATVCHGLQIFT